MRRLLLAVFTLISITAQAQENGEDQLGSWHMYFGTNQIAEKWSIHSEAQLRYYEQAKNFNQLLLRTGLNYHINPNAIATAGFAYIKTDPTFFEAALIDLDGQASDNISENRIFEQFILKNKVWELLFEHRYRLEQRFITDSDLNTKSTQHRARYRLQMTVPLTDVFFLNFYDEIFINLQNEAFDQNRLYAAVGVNVTNNLSVQAGYLKNHFRTVDYDRLQVAVFYNPDLRKLFK
ncbi:DUF2490 domain-containing protein [Maribacter sp. PR1]|uniref:DUF2490 domain-containing protein n=1 Tax=Maribacter cobaltidurans TaxID=1178778 RepID=A0ABU7IV09_9FLAO|nr:MULTISPECIES: DUF2490 domain-containing protein [Maribacter]MDC6389435.1 DUF2490 domain-containing protein [Maribacter sp. PR1]MEE1976824.1 DUF2490 domain-containing protein [Maribacter cobaltidurans]